MRTRRIGSLEVPVVGLGCWPIAGHVHDLDEDAPAATVDAALDAGVRLFDTARAYCPDGDNGFGERQLRRLLDRRTDVRDEVVVATKVVSTRTADGAWTADGSPEAVRRMAHEACANLGVEQLDLLQSHTVDHRVPWAETVGALLALREEGVAREVGLSNVDADQVREAVALGPVASVQNETGADGVDEAVLAVCAELDLAFLPYSPFGGPGRAADLPARRAVLAEVGAEHGVSAWRVCLAWLLGIDERTVQIPAATRPATIADSAAAGDLALSDEQVARLDAALR